MFFPASQSFQFAWSLNCWKVICTISVQARSEMSCRKSKENWQSAHDSACADGSGEGWWEFLGFSNEPVAGGRDELILDLPAFHSKGLKTMCSNLEEGIAADADAIFRKYYKTRVPPCTTRDHIGSCMQFFYHDSVRSPHTDIFKEKSSVDSASFAEHWSVQWNCKLRYLQLIKFASKYVIEFLK